MWRKQSIAVLIIISLGLQSFKYYGVLAEFYLNRDYIAKNLCENRDKPKLHCNGKCQLKKQLQKEEQQQQQNNTRVNKASVPFLYCNEIEPFSFINYSAEKCYLSYTSKVSSSFLPTLLRPPCQS